MSTFGDFLEAQRKRASIWLTLFLALLAVLVVCNFFLRPAEPHFGLDIYPGFWAVFGLGVGLIMVFVMKRLIQPLICVKEDFYGDI